MPDSNRENTELYAAFFHTMRAGKKRRVIPGQDRLARAIRERAEQQAKEGGQDTAPRAREHPQASGSR